MLGPLADQSDPGEVLCAAKGIPAIHTHKREQGELLPREALGEGRQYTHSILLDLKPRDCKAEATVAMIPVRLLEEQDTYPALHI